MSDLLAGLAGGLGLFIAGMWLLTENLKAMANYRVRQAAIRWTSNRYSALQMPRSRIRRERIRSPAGRPKGARHGWRATARRKQSDPRPQP